MKDSLVHHAHKVHLLRLLGRTGSLRRAALEAGVTPSAFSQSMSQLESFLGATLIRRTRGGAALTSEGETLVANLSPFLDGIDSYDLKQTIREFIPRRIAIGAYDSIAITVFPKILTSLKLRHPQLILNIVTARSHGLYSAVREGNMDLAIVVESEDPGLLDTVRVAEEQLGLYVSSQHEISDETCQSAMEKYGVATISPGYGGYPRYYQNFLKGFESFSIAILTDSFETVAYLTRSGAVVGLLPARVAARHSTYLRIISPVNNSNSDGAHHFALISRKNLAPQIKSLLLEEIKSALLDSV